MVARPEQELGANVDRAFLVRAHVNRRVPVETKLFLVVVGKRLDGPYFQRVPIDPANGPPWYSA